MSASAAVAQRLAQRVSQAERRARRRLDKKKLKETVYESQAQWQHLRITRKKITKEIIRARQWRREDWDLGDLAPMRHSNEMFGMGQKRTAMLLTAQQYIYGKNRYNLPRTGKPFRSEHDPVHLKKHGWKALALEKKELQERKKEYKEFMAKEKWRKIPFELREKSKRFDVQDSYWLRPDFRKEDNVFFPGDLVVMTRGTQAGQIGVVKNATEMGDGATVEGIQEMEIKHPHWFFVAQQLDNPIGTIERPINNRYLKLILMPGKQLPEDAEPVILEKMILTRTWQPLEGTYSEIERRIPGLNTILEDPKKRNKDDEDEDNEDTDFGDAYDADTLRITGEEVTFTPSMNNLPMPESVIDELRGKYSKFRERFDHEHTAMLEQKERDERAKVGAVKSMSGPVSQLNRRISDQAKIEWDKRKKEAGSLAAIGEAIAKLRLAEKGADMDAAEARM